MTNIERKFALKHVFSNVSEMNEKDVKHSVKEMHFGISWRIKFEKCPDHLGAYLYCEPDEEGDWTVETESSLEIVSPLGKTAEFRITDSFKKDATFSGTPTFINWTEMEKDYTKNDQILMKCHVTVKKITGITKKKLRNFDESMRDLSDVVLKVGDEKFHVSKLTLANHSSYFKAIFFGKLDEAKKPEIELKEIDPSDFQDFLETIYGDPAVNDDNVEGILKLAERYDASIVTRKCEEYLLTSSGIPTEEKLRLSNRFNSSDLLQACLDEQKTVKDVVAHLPFDLNLLTDHSTKEILQKVVELANSL